MISALIPRRRTPLLLVAISALFFIHKGFSQSNQPFSVEAYKQFLAGHQNMTSEQLRSIYPAGYFLKKAPTRFADATYSDSIDIKFKLTTSERSLIEQNGFMVSERLSRTSFGDALEEIYDNDLPVFVSVDAILHAVHRSYDLILMDVEQSTLIKKLDTLLTDLHGQLPSLGTKYASYPGMKQNLIDVDLYLTVARRLLGNAIIPLYPETVSPVDSILDFVQLEQYQYHPLFSSQPKKFDYSQFTVRGHYTQSEDLKKYFQAMIWLGRTEIYLTAPINIVPPVPKDDVQRQAIDAVLIEEAAATGNVFPLLAEIEEALQSLVGESDNVTLPDIQSLVAETQIDSACQLLDTVRLAVFQQTLNLKPYAGQRILSQIVESDPSSPDDVTPPSAFLLFGQRFVIDSYITGNVVYKKIKFNGEPVWRALPSSQDVLFALGNNASAQLLESELSQFHYATNLSSLRYLVDSYEPPFWQLSFYNAWLNSIRTLNPPTDRTGLPQFMQTAAWWQEKMTTQLASWAELRHDNLLYVKQSYTSSGACSFPESYVEPIPEFYEALRQFASTAAQKSKLLTGDSRMVDNIVKYWQHLGGVADTLASIAHKELVHTSLSDEETMFLHCMIGPYNITGCGGDRKPQSPGWYNYLYYRLREYAGYRLQDYLVADVHTCPTDQGGGLVGWVMHVGTGPVNLAVVATEAADGRLTSYIGPVSSYYEQVTSGFKRLTDEEWATAYRIAPSYRPDLVNMYLADSLGHPLIAGSSLITGMDQDRSTRKMPTTFALAQNYPNPFNPSTAIEYQIPKQSFVTLRIYDLLGREVAVLVNEMKQAGTHSVKWDASRFASGVYFCTIASGSYRETKKMILMK